MTSIIKNAIQYTGLSNKEDFCLIKESFNHIFIQEDLIVLYPKPNIKKVIKVMTDISITDERVISTAVGTSLEGQVLTGKKIIIEGELVEQIEYACDDIKQSIYTACFKIPFCSYIVVPNNVTQNSVIEIRAYIEDIFIQKIDERKLFLNGILLLEAVVKE
ncbi:MAG: DUF3794 domain-containing protein [Maledivibacter sp.]|jgi:hypothetical protein|nr:DUF3794 domain-containing protein [Maledivibacter sp.]